MITKKNVHFFVFISFCLYSFEGLRTEVRTAEQVFGKWIDWQRVFSNKNSSVAHKSYNDAFWGRLQANYQKNTSKLSEFEPFLHTLTDGRLGGHAPENGKNSMIDYYAWLDRNPGALLQYMKGAGFINQEINRQEQSMHVDHTIKKHKKLLHILSNQPDKASRSEYVFSFANRLFEWCFGSKTHTVFDRLTKKPNLHQLARFCYSTMWYNLVGEGWLHWHEDCIKQLGQEACNRKEVVYIAGGNDIYQLLKNKIYNIRVIDPMLPSQPEYYSEGWDWLMESDALDRGVGDRVDLSFGARSLYLKRETYDSTGAFEAELSTGENAILPMSTTVWGVYDAANNQRLGTVTFERRFCCQNDFSIRNDQALLMSFNEMYFVAMPPEHGGWGMDLGALPADMKMYVKQLRTPVGTKHMERIRKTECSGKFSYIMLGSTAT